MELVLMGHQRIIEIIKLGIDRGAFRCEDPGKSAKIIQVQLTGALTILGTEEEILLSNILEEKIIDLCFDIAGGKRKKL